MKKYFFLLLGFLLPSYAFAIDVVSPTPAIVTTDIPTSFIANIISYAIALTGVIGVIGITWAGIQLVLASGEEEKIKKARFMIIYSTIGVLLAGMAYPIVKLISSLTF